ncbi:MAG: ABC transporter permease [Actinobacteria bacterium]|nr:ABC transporter permease [Actinomycetota bacterium]
MLKFVIRRLLVSVPVIFVSSMLVFWLATQSGDPLAPLRQNPRISRATIAARESQLHLREPIVQRYVGWIKGVVRGDLGVDVQGNPVWPQLWRAMKISLRLLVFTLILSVLLALAVGVFSAVRQYSVFDYSSTFTSFLFYSLPVFWLGALLKEGGIRLNQSLGIRFIQTVGSGGGPDIKGFGNQLYSIAGSTVLPALSLIIISYAGYSRYVRASMLDTLGSDYVRTARAKGLRQRRVVLAHAMRNALIPVTTVVALDFGTVIAGAVVTETVFQWRGMGSLFLKAASNSDVYTIGAYLLVTASFVVVFNLVADVVYALLDPRIRLE